MIVILGATSRLAAPLRAALERRDVDVLLVSRRQVATRWIGPVDVTDRDWRYPESWQALFADHGIVADRITAVINLVTRKSGTQRAVTAVNVGGVQAMLGLREAVTLAGARPLTVHVASVSEYQIGSASVYAVGKRAAHKVARDGGVDLIVTFGVLTDSRRPPLPLLAHLLLRRLPWLTNKIEIPFLDFDAAAEVLTVLATEGKTVTRWREIAPLEARVLGDEQPLSRLLAASGWVSTPSHYERALLRLLASLPWPRSGWVGRIARFARIALTNDPNSSSHYRLSSAAQLTAASLATSIQIGCLLIAPDPSGIHDLLVRPRLSTVGR